MNEEAGEVRVIAGALAVQPDLAALGVSGGDEMLLPSRSMGRPQDDDGRMLNGIV
ncbi:hypothetical protein [Microtetraspora glauca]|uniref:Uncharacterized protein n=1 Tax=Microtetraspora glauca TaxID=1996 RepID=A0ABV3GGT4_MICGL